MNLTSILQKSSKKVVGTLPFKKSSVLLSISLTLVLFLSLSSLGNANVGSTDSLSSIAQTPVDMDGDGLNDTLEDMLKTEKDNKFGDKDMDGLYDFEEYLDHYGTPSNTGDTPKYNYNDSTSYDGDNGPILDIYHYFNLSSNKTNYLRDQNFTEANGGFTDYLLWNVSFPGDYSGGSVRGDVSYSNNMMIDVSFTGDYSGGSVRGDVSYSNNMMIDVSFTGDNSGGSVRGDVSYSRNMMIDANFTGYLSGGSEEAESSYSYNSISDVIFSGIGSGAGLVLTYNNNNISDVIFSGENSGGGLEVFYRYNDMSDVIFSGIGSGGSNILDSGGLVLYIENMMSNVTFSGNYSGGSRNGNAAYSRNTVSNLLFSGDHAGMGLDELYFTSGNVIVNDSFDTDDDGLGDGHELLKSSTDPRNSDTDSDGLNDSFEVLVLMTNASSEDTDGDGLADAWEVRYNGSSGVNPLVAATVDELVSDEDSDGLTLLEEEKANTDPGTADNTTMMNTTPSTISLDVSSSVLLVVLSVLTSLGIITSLSLALVIYRMRRRMREH